MMKNKFCSIVISLFFLSGCAALLVGAGAGAVGGYYWANGAMDVNYNSEMESTYQAAIQAAQDMGYTNLGIEYQDLDGIDCVSIEAKNINNYSSTITVSEETHNITKVRVKFGWLGDRELSMLYHTYLQKHLNKKNE